MSTNLENLLSEYDQKRRNAQMTSERKRQELYKKFIELEQFDSKISQLAINKTKAILNNSSNIENFDLEIENLKQEKKWGTAVH